MRQNNIELYDTESKKKTKKINVMQSLITEALLMGGVLGMLFCFLSDGTGRAAMIITALVSILYLSVVGRWKEKLEILRLAPIAVGILAIVFNPVGASRGFLFFCNQWIDLWDNRFNQLIPELQVSGVSVAARVQIFIFIIAVAAVWIHNQVCERHAVRLTFFVFLLIFVTALFQMDISLFYVVAMIMGWLLIWLSAVSIRFITMKHIPAILPGLLIVLFLGILFGRYSGNEAVEDLKADIYDETDKIRYGEDTLPRGDMEKAGAMVGSDTEETLKLTTDDASEMYLKGYVGGDFDGAAWKELTYADYSSEEIAMFRWLTEQSFEVSYQYDNYTTYTGNAADEETGTVEIENVGADRRYVYLPYEITRLSEGRGQVNRDYQMRSAGVFGEDTYSYEMYVTDQPTETIVQSQLDDSISGASQYAQTEQVYLSYVYDNYLNLSEEQTDELNQLFFADGDWSNASLYQVTEQIRIVFQQLTTYTNRPQEYRGESDFINWFLNEVKSGNSAYYATVAALAYRAAGIPARYAEGYYLTASDAQRYKENGQSEITLTQADAHAWVEVYMDGLGWMPVEVVPGFYYAEYTTQQIVGSPESSVNIVNETDEQQLQGSTTDSLEASNEDEKKDKDIPAVEKVIRVVGILLLIAIILWLIQFIILLRYRLMRTFWEKRLKQADSQEGSRIRYHHVNDVLRESGIGVKEEFPYDNIPQIVEKLPEIQEFECKRFVQLLQKVVFGQQDLTTAEYKTVQIFDDKVTKLSYESLSDWKKLIVKYWKALV